MLSLTMVQLTLHTPLAILMLSASTLDLAITSDASHFTTFKVLLNSILLDSDHLPIVTVLEPTNISLLPFAPRTVWRVPTGTTDPAVTAAKHDAFKAALVPVLQQWLLDFPAGAGWSTDSANDALVGAICFAADASYGSKQSRTRHHKFWFADRW